MVTSQLERVALEGTAYEQLIHAAMLAPSGDNTQPWRFQVDSEHSTISIQLDETRDPSPMNAGQRMSRIAIGAALENLLQTAVSNELTASLIPTRGGNEVKIQLDQVPQRLMTIDARIHERVTNRRMYSAGTLAAEIRAFLELETPDLQGVRTHWMYDSTRIDQLARYIGRADALMFGDPGMRRAFLANVRFDAVPDAVVDEGLSLASLELSRADRFALRVMSMAPNVLLKHLRAFRVFEKLAVKLVKSATGVCIVSAPNDSWATDFNVGRAMERAWLALTEKGMAVQPMASIVVLDSVRGQGIHDVESLFGKQADVLLNEASNWFTAIGEGRAAFILRFGFAERPTGRTGRREIQDVARIV